jgi:4-hydroxyphenylpyruvate dioxygenase-like putative hemolysin
VGHVSGFLKEYGQGVQHIASRVGDIIGFVQQANDRRKMFGEVSILE